MLGKTHMMAGIAATLAITQPSTLSELLMISGAGAIGALISDLDIGTSDFHKEANKVIILTVFIVGLVFALDYYCGTKIIEKITRDSGQMRIVTGILLMTAICIFGKEQPHRTFLHSFLGLIALCASLEIIAPILVPYFIIGFLSHLALDIFNKKGVRLFYPMKLGVCLNLFRSGGITDTLLFIAFMVIAVAEICIALIKIYM